jgi:hypothetical protein
MRPRSFLETVFFLSLGLLPAGLCASTATVNVNTTVQLNTFVPRDAFGVNVMFWNGKSGLTTVAPKISAAGNRFIRYPGGSSSDDFHWNGTGSYDGQGHWVPDNTSYGLSFVGTETYRGTTSSYGAASMLTDGDNSTAWLSNPETDAPNAQWAYVDLGSAKAVSQVQIQWGMPYATTFRVQYWTGSAGWPLPYLSATDQWADCGNGIVAYSGVSQTVNLTATRTSQWFRVLCLSSSVSPAQYSIAELKCFNGATQVSKNVATYTNGSPDQSWGTVSSTDQANSKQQVVDFDFESFMAWLPSCGPNAKPLITINFGTGTPQEAAAWVHYANVVRGYGIKDWEIGNEMDGNWETGGPLSAKDYARRYILFYQAMKAEDPGIHVYGPVAGGPYDASDDHDGKTYIQGFVDRLAADAGGSKAAYAEGIDFHWYPLFQDNVEADSFATVNKIGTFANTDLPSMLANHPAPSTVPILMTEYNDGINENLTVRLCNGLWLADWLGQFLTYFGSRGSSHVWDAVEGGDASTSLTGASLGYLDGSSNAYQYQERAHYWAMQLLTQRWAIAGDLGTHQLVQANSSSGFLKAYADKRPDGVTSLLLINEDPSNTITATINVAGFVPNSTAARWTFDGTNYAWNTTSVPYHASPDTAPVAGTESGVGASWAHNCPPYSLTVLQLTDSSAPLATATPSPSALPSATPTPTFGPQILVDDFEDPTREGTPPWRLNLWNGTWGLSQASGVSDSISYGAPGADGTSRSAAWSLTVPAGGWANFSTSLPTFNAAAAGFIGLEFWAYGDGKTYRAMIQTQTVTDFDQYGLNITPPAGQWTFYQIPFSSMTRQGWGGQTPTPPTHPVANDIIGLQFAVQSTGTLAFKLDQIGFYQASGIASPTATRSATPTRSPTPTPTASPTWTSSPTPSATATASPTATLSPVLSPTPSATQSPLLSPTPTATPSATPSVSPSPSVTPSLTLSVSMTPTLTPSISASPSPAGPSDPGGRLELVQAVAAPQPQTGPDYRFRVLLAGGAQWMDLKLYSVSYRLLESRRVDSPLPAGWSELDAHIEGLVPGLYFVVLSPGRDGQGSVKGGSLRLVVLR